jgi:hypothetical protein
LPFEECTPVRTVLSLPDGDSLDRHPLICTGRQRLFVGTSQYRQISLVPAHPEYPGLLKMLIKLHI